MSCRECTLEHASLLSMSPTAFAETITTRLRQLCSFTTSQPSVASSGLHRFVIIINQSQYVPISLTMAPQYPHPLFLFRTSSQAPSACLSTPPAPPRAPALTRSLGWLALARDEMDSVPFSQAMRLSTPLSASDKQPVVPD